MANVRSFWKKHGDWIKTGAYLIIIFLIAHLLPDKPIDSWKILNPQKIVQLIGALCSIHFIGHIVISTIGNREGLFISGFIGGLVSSTAMTLSLTKKTKNMDKKSITNESIIFLSSTLAMLFEAVLFLFIGAKTFEPSLLIIFTGPVLCTIACILVWKRKSVHKSVKIENKFGLDFISSLKLTLFIVSILAISKFGQNLFGNNGLISLTALVSLFEVHGSIIANIQLFQQKAIDLKLLGQLITISIFSSYISKMGIIYFSGNKILKKLTTYWTIAIVISLIISWVIFNSLTN